jgi:peroxiredoxin
MEAFSLINSILLWAVVLLNLLLTLALIRRQHKVSASPEVAGLKKGELAPNFETTTLDGTTVTLDTFIGGGKSAAFLMISPTCGPCREALPQYEALFQKAVRAGVNLALVSNGEVEAMRELAQEFNLTAPVLVTTPASTSFWADYKVRATPSYCLVSPTGEVKSSGYPNFNGGDWKRFVDSVEEVQSALVAAGERR